MQQERPGQIIVKERMQSGQREMRGLLRKRIRTNNAIERLNREIGRRTRVVGTFPDGKSALVPVAARLEYVADGEWGSRRYLDVTLLEG